MKKIIPFDVAKASDTNVIYRNGEKPLDWKYFPSVNSEYCPIASVRTGGHPIDHHVDGRAKEKMEYDLMLQVEVEERVCEYWCYPKHRDPISGHDPENTIKWKQGDPFFKLRLTFVTGEKPKAEFVD